MPIPTYFIDSTQHSAVLMNAKKSREGLSLAKDFTYLGRAGITEINGLRIAYLSGIDID